MRPPKFPDHLLIVGGGTAGWLAAAFLDRTFNQTNDRRLKITVVESPSIGRIGVGEATIPNLRETFNFLGLEERDVMSRCSATLKHGVLFQDWAALGHTWFHPFEALTNAIGADAAPAWLARRARGERMPFAQASGIQYALAADGYSPKRLMENEYGGPLPYAYHLDAEELADYLTELAVGRGVDHVRDDVVAVTRRPDGDITAVTLKSGGSIEADFFIDCTGFRALLIEDTLGVPYTSYAQHLLCDRAVAIRAPYTEPKPIPPMTVTRGLSAGWMWRIGLQSREGIGYVYSSAFVSDDEAEAELRRVAGLPADLPARRLRMKVGKRAESWSHNCLSIGLSGGFIEPLESTGIFLAERAVRLFVRYFPHSGVNPSARQILNADMSSVYDETRDFIVGHYCLTRRDDTPFWREVQKPERIPDTLKTYLELWKDRVPAFEDIPARKALFSHPSWQQLLYGMEHASDDLLANAAYWVRDTDGGLSALRRGLEAARLDLPSHNVWLSGLD